MKAIVYDAPRQFKYKEVPEPEIESDDVLVRIDACGLCGTDLHIHEGEFAPNFPLIPGHEFTGEIVALGNAVKGSEVNGSGSSETAMNRAANAFIACAATFCSV